MAKPNERPEKTPDRNVEAGVEGTFPASDPVAATTAQGSRAVPPEQMMHGGAGTMPPDPVALEARFRDQESAKLALEALVREGPVDRRLAEIRPGDDAVTLRVIVARPEAERLRRMAERYEA